MPSPDWGEGRGAFWKLEHLDLVIVSDFDIWISNFPGRVQRIQFDENSLVEYLSGTV